MNIKSVSLGLLLLFLIAAPPSWASPFVLSPESAELLSGSSMMGGYDIGNTINQSGITGGNWSTDEANLTPWDAVFQTKNERQYTAGGPSHSNSIADQWLSGGGTLATIRYDLGDHYHINRIALWDENMVGISNFTVWFGNDPTTTWNFTPSDTTDQAEIFNLTFDQPGTYRGQFVYLDVTGKGGGFWGASMGEIAFSATPAPLPPAAFLLFSGLLGIASFRRFKR